MEMNAWGFFASVISSLAWPAAVLAVIYFARGYLSGLLDRLTTVKYKDFQADFSRKIEQLTQDVAKEVGERRVLAPAAAAGAPDERYNRLADISPAAAVVHAFLDVENTLRMMAQHHGISLDRGSSALYLTRMMYQKGAIDQRTASILDQLRALRNQAVHGSGSEITREQATEYRELADEVMRILAASAD